MKKLLINHRFVPVLTLVACIVAQTNVSRAGESELTLFDSKALSLPARVVDAQEREDAFQSGRVAFFKTTLDAKPTLEVYDPLNHEVVVSTFDNNLLYLKPLSAKKYDFGSYKVYEDYFDSSAKASPLDKLFRSTSTPNYASPFFSLYLKNVPTCLLLKDEKELSLLVAHMRMLFERSGLTPSVQKPLLVISIDGKTTELPGLFADADFLNKYFYVASFADEEVKNAFLESHKDMAEQVRGVNGAVNTKYPKDGFIGGVVRDINKAASGFNATKLAVQGTTGIVTLVGSAVIGGIFKDPIIDFFQGKTNNGVKHIKGKAEKFIKDKDMLDLRARAEKQVEDQCNQNLQKLVAAKKNDKEHSEEFMKIMETKEKLLINLQYYPKEVLKAFLKQAPTTS